MEPEETELLGRSLPEADGSESVPQTSYHGIDYAGNNVKWLLWKTSCSGLLQRLQNSVPDLWSVAAAMSILLSSESLQQ